MEIWKYKLLVNYISLNKFYTLLFPKCLFYSLKIFICFCYVTERRTFYWNSKYGHQKRDDPGNNLHNGYHVTRYGIWSFIQTTVLKTAHILRLTIISARFVETEKFWRDISSRVSQNFSLSTNLAKLDWDVIVLSVLVGGFYTRSLPFWLDWIKYVSFLQYTFSAMMCLEFNDGPDIRFVLKGFLR